jgi:hypothetical protein
MQQPLCKSMVHQREPSHFRVLFGKDVRSAWHSLYALCLHPLLRTLEMELTGVKVGQRARRVSIVAYADDVTVFVTHPTDFVTIRNVVRTFEEATGAHLNPKKSKALAVGTWAKPPTILGIGFCHHVKILGVMFGPSLNTTVKETWTSVNAAVCAQARKAYDRNLCLAQRIKFVHLCLLAKIWYVAQVLPPLAAHTHQLTAIISWFIWKGATFRVPGTTLQQPKKNGGWALSNVAAKCRTLLISSLWKMSMRTGSVTATLLQNWNMASNVPNLPCAHHIPAKLAHFHHYALDIAYITPPANDESMYKFRKRIYGILQELADAGKEIATIRIVRKHPTTPRKRVWTNLHSAWIPDPFKSAWYVAMHEIIPTNERLATIRLADTDRCNLCGNTDSLQHRLTRCGAGSVIWNWMRARLAAITRTDPRTIPEEWTLRPDCLFWPPPKQAALLWILAHLVVYRTQSNRRLCLQDYTDFLRRARWKAYQRPDGRSVVGNSGSPLVPPTNEAHRPNFRRPENTCHTRKRRPQCTLHPGQESAYPKR